MIETGTSLIFELISDIFKRGNRKIKILFILALVFMVLAFTSQTLGEVNIIIFGFAKIITLIFGISAGLFFIASIVIFSRTIENKEEKKSEELEKKYQEHPDQTKTAWDLARVKLESYLNKNLRQVRSIYLLTILIMFIGFIIIGIGIFKAYEKPENIDASILVTISGVLVNFIGATFLVIYKSTMNQAKEYVSVLERINAVGMSIQILEKIKDDNDNLKDKTSAEIAKELLNLYAIRNNKN